MSCATPTVSIVWTEGDTDPDFTGRRKGLDLTGMTVNLRMTRPSGGNLVKAATILDTDPQANPQWQFEFAASDLVAGLQQLCQIEITDGASFVTTSPDFYVDVKAKIVP